MRLGIRAQLLSSLAALLVLAFVPLFFVLANAGRASLQRSWQQHAHALGRTIGGHVSEARRVRSAEQLDSLLDAQIGHGVGAIGVYDTSGALQRHAGEEPAAQALPAQVSPDHERALDVTTPRGAAIVVLIPSTKGPVGVLLHTDPQAVQVGPLVRLVALYLGLLAVVLLAFSYLVLTRIVINPVEQLSRAAARVADGARSLTVPRTGGRELVDLGGALSQMTARLLAEEEKLRQKVAEIQAATDELRRTQDSLVRSERLASVGRLAAGLAHEIGNPITAILGFQQLMLEEDLDPEGQRDFLQRMSRETERVNKVLRDLLDFARPAVRSLHDDEADEEISASVGEAVSQVVALIKPQKCAADVEIITALEEELPAVAMRADRIEQVLLNLLLNSTDAVPKPGGQITITAVTDEETVQLSIEDNGGGIDPDVRERLFEPFVTTKDVGKGTGLGLAVCRGLVEAAGGKIQVEDGAAGARFVFTLPRARFDEE